MNDRQGTIDGGPLAPLVVVMGVCGSGKSTIGTMLARATGFDFIDGDTLHPPANVAKMAAGVPLDDDDRRPWLQAIGEKLGRAPGGRIVACSALKRRYREQIAAAAGRPVFFLHLAGSEPVLAERMKSRKGHFMPATLLRSQLDTLESPSSDEFAAVVDGDPPLDAVFEAALASLRAATAVQA